MERKENPQKDVRFLKNNENTILKKNIGMEKEPAENIRGREERNMLGCIEREIDSPFEQRKEEKTNDFSFWEGKKEKTRTIGHF